MCRLRKSNSLILFLALRPLPCRLCFFKHIKIQLLKRRKDFLPQAYFKPTAPSRCKHFLHPSNNPFNNSIKSLHFNPLFRECVIQLLPHLPLPHLHIFTGLPFFLNKTASDYYFFLIGYVPPDLSVSSTVLCVPFLLPYCII